MKGQRPKGYMDWSPTPEVREVVMQVRSVLDEYRSYGPMTVRQIFYRLVGQYGYPKDERAYKRLAEYLVKARRSQMIPFGRIRDDGTISHVAGGETTREDVWQYVLDIVANPDHYMRLDRNDGQAHHIELWCEAAGMAPMLSQMVRFRDVSVYSTGGFSSVTVTHEVAKRVLSRDKPTYFLHVGDYDPSGESIFTSMSQDIGAFVIGEHGGSWNSHTGEITELNNYAQCLFIPRRVALTEDQVEEFDLPTAPPKASDSRSANWGGETTQAEAMPPTVLEQVVREALEDLTDAEAIIVLEQREEDEKERLRQAVNGVDVAEIVEEMDGDRTLVALVEALAARDTDN